MDPAQKKTALRMLTYGLYVVTARDGERVGAGTITWLSQSSFEPPLVVVGIQRDSTLNQVVVASRAFAVNLIGKSQKKLATAFFKTATVHGDQLNGFAFAAGVTGAPVLADAPAWFECRVLDQIDRGDHTVFVAEVVEAGVRREEEPITLKDAGFSYGG